MISLVDQIRPRAVMIENVRGFLSSSFAEYRERIRGDIEKLGYVIDWKVLNALDFGVPQLRQRTIIIALRRELADSFAWPTPSSRNNLTVGGAIGDLMSSRGWLMAKEWAKSAAGPAPTIVGGSRKHGGADLGPTGAKKAWARLGVDGAGIADDAPEPSFVGLPRLTTRMIARLQAFPDHWRFCGGKTAVFRQIGNAFPPPVACAMGESIRSCLSGKTSIRIPARRKRAS